MLGTACVPARAAGADSCPVPAPAPEQWPGESTWKALAAQHYRVGKIQIQVDNVFDLNDPAQQTWYAYTADTLHINTHPGVIESLLLFKPGDTLSVRLIYETERRLRAQTFLRDARVAPLACHDGTVDLVAHVKDAWTLKGSLKFAHVGGQTNAGLSFEDVNFLGTGKTLEIDHKEDVQRTTNQLGYQDPALFGTPWQLGATYAHLSDGHIQALDLGQPFYEDTVPWSLFVHYLNQAQTLYFYNQGNVVWYTSDNQQKVELDWMHLYDWQNGTDDSGTRLGASYFYQKYFYGTLKGVQSFLVLPPPDPPILLPPNLMAPPLPNRRYAGPALTGEYFQDRYASFTNLALMSRTEDYNMGWDTRGQVGYYGSHFGSDAPAWFWDVNSSYGAEWPGDTVLLANGSLEGRRQPGQYDNVLGNLTFTIYNQHFTDQTLVLHGQLQDDLRPDPENYIYLGGLEGMPGYPNYYYIGDRAWQFHLADRYFTHSYLFNTFQIGLVAYADVGQIRQLNNSGWSTKLADAGVGLRLGDIRSAYGGVIYVTFAWPLVKQTGANERQFVIGNILTF